MKKYILALSTFVMFASCGKSNVELILMQSDKVSTPINENWQFRQVGKDKWMTAVVPGVVHTDLFAVGEISDPYFSTNEKDLQWIENEEWEYQTTFIPSLEQLASNEIILDFKGLDTYADVYFNDQKILETDNMYVEWKVPVKSILKEGDNTLRILFKSAYKIGCELAKQYPKLPADNDKGVDYKTSVFTRKAPYHFGWDWGPRFVTAGIWKPVYLESYSNAVIDNIHFVQNSQSDSLATFDAKVTISSLADGNVKVIITDENGVEYAKSDVAIKAGEQTVSLPFVIENPELWWPNGMGKGNSPKLYTINTIITDGKTKFDDDSQRVGVRTIELVREKDEHGESFLFEVNGVPLFMKGANIIPQDVFLPNVTKERYEKLVDIAVEANMNMLRIWGGGIYESDDFYNYCDENGIMLWQDFPFACSFYPWDEKFYNSVRLEAKQNIRRLRNHPSLAIWCGNNEIDEAWHAWGYTNNKDYPWSDQDKKNIRKGIDDLFFDVVIPGVLKEEDPQRSYHPSSPVYSWGNPLSQVAGDVHYWGVFHGEEPFSVYKDKPGRFSNEYGHQSLANYDTWAKSLKPEELKLYSEAMHIHQKNPKGYRVIEDYMKREVPLLKDDFRTYVYLSQLVQADGIRIAMEGHRQNRPFTMGTLYWQLNDCWPVTSWSSMDYPYGYKALQFFAINSFKPTILSFDKEDKSGEIELWAITDELNDKKGNYKLSLVNFSGDVLWSETADFTLAANTSDTLVVRSVKDMLKGANPKDVFLMAEGETDGEKMKTLFYFLPYKELNLPKADYTVSYDINGKEATAKIKANKLLKGVLFESDITQSNNPSDGYFDMVPGEEREIKLYFDQDVKADQIRVTTLNNILKR